MSRIKTIQVRYTSDHSPHPALYSSHSYRPEIEGSKEQAKADAAASKAEFIKNIEKQFGKGKKMNKEGKTLLASITITG